MVCAYLLSGRECTDAESAVRFFRTAHLRRPRDPQPVAGAVRPVFRAFVGASNPERALRLKGVRIRVTAISSPARPPLLATAADDGGRGTSPPVELARRAGGGAGGD